MIDQNLEDAQVITVPLALESAPDGFALRHKTS